MERIVDTMEENPSKENIMKAQKDYTIEDAIIVTEKVDASCKHEVNLQYWSILYCTSNVFSLWFLSNILFLLALL